jgi:hypothetical protein
VTLEFYFRYLKVSSETLLHSSVSTKKHGMSNVPLVFHSERLGNVVIQLFLSSLFFTLIMRMKTELLYYPQFWLTNYFRLFSISITIRRAREGPLARPALCNILWVTVCMLRVMFRKCPGMFDSFSDFSPAGWRSLVKWHYLFARYGIRPFNWPSILLNNYIWHYFTVKI